MLVKELNERVAVWPDMENEAISSLLVFERKSD